ncbi:hypothetical protein FNV43_RR06548 [Rhamnella rubrinervis]|uniref:BHLH domain-containing protein n=1 Tax=Rhamnella rubrinervis TaxID=2594499 RepID=A0A8K0HER7_9ROSA|nr:hypothetical protein FNV43_RR06548 [Rhamnella rubrinervis]
MCSPENHNWVFDYGLIEDLPVPGGDLPALDPPAFTWPSHSFTAPTALSVDFNDSCENSDGLNETGSRKRVRPESFGSSGSKACREKMRRDRLNDRFLELGSILDPGRPPKMDKAVILGAAVRMAEKNELRDEKQRLKAEKDSLDQQVKALSNQPSFLHPSALAAPYTRPGHVVGSKLVPFGYPGISMWQFMPPAAVDTSQDHVLRPPVA